MITPGMIYLIGILDSIKSFCLFSSVLLGVGAFATFLECVDDENNKKRFGKWRIRLAVLSLIGFLCLTTIPSTKLAAAMYVVPVIANNENVKAIGGNSLEALRKLTEQWLRELNGNGKPSDHEHHL